MIARVEGCQNTENSGSLIQHGPSNAPVWLAQEDEIKYASLASYLGSSEGGLLGVARDPGILEALLEMSKLSLDP